MRRWGHPSTRKLQRWLSGEDLSIGRHVESCDYCADRLEPMEADAEAAIREALVNILTVPEELPDRLRTGIDERLANQRDLTLIGEFFGLPFQTVRVITTTDQEDD